MKYNEPKPIIINLFEESPNFKPRRRLSQTFAEYIEGLKLITLNNSNVIAEQLNMTYYYVGHCGNMFNPVDGQCLSNIFNDVSEFARLDELAQEEPENSEGNGKIDKEEFLAVVDINKQPAPIVEKLKNPAMEFYYYSNGILVAYDPNEDIHYFFSK